MHLASTLDTTPSPLAHKNCNNESDQICSLCNLFESPPSSLKTSSHTFFFRMPPNRKVNSHIVSQAANLQGFVAATPVKPTTESASSLSSEKQTNVDSDTYWNWPSAREKTEKEVIINRILEEERIRHFFTADHVCQNLLQIAQEKHASASNTTTTICGTAGEYSDYWDMHTQEERLPPEEAKYLTSADRIQRNLCRDAVADADAATVQNKQQPKAKQQQQQQQQDSSSYWDWPEETKQERILRRILEDEKARELVSVQHIEMRLEERTVLPPAKLVAEHDDYWAM